MVITRYHFPVNKKIAILSDIHSTPFDISLLEKENPDIILIPGDLCTSHLSQYAYDIAKENTSFKGEYWMKPIFALKLLPILPKIAPTYMSIGNHEYFWHDVDKQIVRESGVILLENEYRKEQGILIGGMKSPYRFSVKKPKITDSAQKFISEFEKEKEYKILLLHEPHLYFEYGIDNMNIDLVVSGHCHGGQWRIFGRGVFAPWQGFFPKYTKGVYNKNLLVSAGMSNTVKLVPRLNNPTEIVMLGKNKTE